MIYKSEQINELALALSNFQGEVHDVYKNSKGYGYDYADLSAVFEVARPLLKKHGLSVTQPVGGSNNMIELNTILMHSSGQYISSIIGVPVDLTNKKMNSLQAAGSTITYLRRYCICSILGLATTDDDGKVGGESLDKEVQQRSFTQVSTPARHTIAQNKPANVSNEQLEELRKQLVTRIIDENIPQAVVETWCARANVQSINQFNYQQVVTSLEYLERRKRKSDDVTSPAEAMNDVVSRITEQE